MIVSALLLAPFTLRSAESQFVPGQILVKSKAHAKNPDFGQKLKGKTAVHDKKLTSNNVRVLNVAPEQMADVLAQLRNDPDIEFAEPDFIAHAAYLPNDPLLASQTAWHISKLQLSDAWNITRGNATVAIAVIDSGITASHPDLAGRVLPGYDFVFNKTEISDEIGHGTAVAGVIVANANNGLGSAGVAPDCVVIPVKVMSSSGVAPYSTIIQGIDYAVNRGARVINLSLAGQWHSTAMQDAINRAWSSNVVVVAAAGNNGNTGLNYPAACEHVIAVSATTPDDQRASFSSFGSHISVAAPGENMWTTSRDGSSYGPWRGTSFASPAVAGVAALIASANPSLSAAQITELITQTAKDLGAPGIDWEFGYGRLDAGAAVIAASIQPGALPPSPPPNVSTNPVPLKPPVDDPQMLDTNAPMVSIASGPGHFARVTNSIIWFSGRSADDSAVQRVEVRLNDGPYQPANGTTVWNAQLSLTAGRNVIRVRAVDAAGNVSRELVRNVTFVVMLPISMQTNGWGNIAPNLDGRLLEIGKTYSVRAVPGSNQVFAGWSGIAAETPLLRFVMQTNLALVANFVPTPFFPVMGNYAGLVADTNGVAPESSGFFKLKVTKLGAYSGHILIGGKRHGFSGRFNLDGHAAATVNRRTNTPISLAFQVDLNEPGDQVAGNVSGGNWNSELNGDRNVFDPVMHPASQAGTRAFVLESSGVNTNAASGLGKISKAGATRVRGKLDDGRVFDTGSSLAKNGDYPFYLSLSRGSEVVIGWLNFPAETDPTANGTILWVKSGTNGFAATLQASAQAVSGK